MQYEVIVLGATFTAAGIAEKYGKKCLIVERSTEAGYEFFGALHFGQDYEQKPVTEEAKKLLDVFAKKKAFEGQRVCLYDCAPSLYKLLEGKNVLLNTEIISVEKAAENEFLCTVHGVKGYRTFKAKRVVDTRVHAFMYSEKTFNFSVDTKDGFCKMPGMLCEKWGFERNAVLRIPMEKEASYSEARKKVYEAVKHLPDGAKLLCVANVFDYAIDSDYSVPEDGVVYLPSKAYKNPVLAFDAGVLFGGDAK